MNKTKSDTPDWRWTCGGCQEENREAEHPRVCPSCRGSRRDGSTSWVRLTR